MTTVVDAAEQIDANSFIPFMFLREGPEKIGGSFQIEEKISEQNIRTIQKAATESIVERINAFQRQAFELKLKKVIM